MGIVNKLDYTIQYQDIDQNFRLRLYTLENFLLNAAGRVADENGFGMKYLKDQNCTWVLTNLNVELSYLPTVDETLTLETWVEQNIHMLSVRNFRLYVGDVLIGQAKSVWAVISTIDRTAQKIFNQPVFADMTTGETVDLHRTTRMMPFSAEQKQALKDRVENENGGCVEHRVVYSDIDYNGHCNSCKYLEMMLNVCEPVSLKKELPDTPTTVASCKSVLRLDMKYARELYRGENVEIFYRSVDNEISYEICTSEGEISCQARISTI